MLRRETKHKYFVVFSYTADQIDFGKQSRLNLNLRIEWIVDTELPGNVVYSFSSSHLHWPEWCWPTPNGNCKAMMLKEPWTNCFKLFLSFLSFTVDETQFSRLHENFSSFSINVQRALDAYFCFDGFLMHFNGAWKFQEVKQSRKVF